MNLLDRLATWWLVHRHRLVNLKPNPMRIEVPFPLSEEEAEKLRAAWMRTHRGYMSKVENT